MQYQKEYKNEHKHKQINANQKRQKNKYMSEKPHPPSAPFS